MAKNRTKQRANRRLYGCQFGVELLDTHGTAGYNDPVPAAALNPYIRANMIIEKRTKESRYKSAIRSSPAGKR